MGAKTETEAIERTPDSVIEEVERNRQWRAAHERFLNTAKGEGLEVLDAFDRHGTY